MLRRLRHRAGFFGEVASQVESFAEGVGKAHVVLGQIARDAGELLEAVVLSVGKEPRCRANGVNEQFRWIGPQTA